MKTKEKLNALKEEVETMNKKFAELSEEELTLISGGVEYGLTSEYDGEFPSTYESLSPLYKQNYH